MYNVRSHLFGTVKLIVVLSQKLRGLNNTVDGFNFLEGLINEFQYPLNFNFLCELLNKILWPQILNSMNVLFLFNPRKIGTHKNKAIHGILHLGSTRNPIPEIIVARSEFKPQYCSTSQEINHYTPATPLIYVPSYVWLKYSWQWRHFKINKEMYYNISQTLLTEFQELCHLQQNNVNVEIFVRG